jgi:AraC-like DNA-binding protein
MSAKSLMCAQRLRQRAFAEQTSLDAIPYVDLSAPHAPSAFLDELIVDLFVAPRSDAPRKHLDRRRAFVDRARRELASAPGAPHRLPNLANALGMSTFHFARTFRAETGLSVHQYLLRLRMACALRRLSCRDTELSRLALDLGFSSHSHFTATFHREFGVNPAHVRNLFHHERLLPSRGSSKP